MSNFVTVEIRGNSAQLKSELGSIPGLLSSSGRAAEGTAKAAYGQAGRAGGQSMVAGLSGELKGGTSRIAESNRQMTSGISTVWQQAGAKSGSAFGSAVLAGTSTIGSRVASNSMRGIVPAMANAGRSAATAFATPFTAIGKKIANTLKTSIDSVKDGIGLGIGSQLTGGLISGVTGAIGSVGSTKNAADLDQATRKNATLQLGNVGGDPSKAIASSRALSAEIGLLNKSLGFVSTTASSATAAYDILSTGFTKNVEVIQILKAAMKGAATDGSEVGTVVDGMTSAIKGLGLSANDSAYVIQQMVGVVDVGKIKMSEYGSLIGKIAPTIGLIGGNVKQNFEQINSIIATSTAAGVKPGATINGLADALKSVLKPTKEATAEATALKLVLNQKELAENGLVGVLKQLQKSDLKDALKEVTAAAREGGDALARVGENPSTNLKKLITIFGTVEAVAAIATATGEKGLLAIAAAADQIGKTDIDKKFGLVMGGLTAKTEAFKNKLTDLDAQLKTPGFTDIASKAFDYMSKAVDSATKGLGELNAWYGKLQPGNKELVKNVAIATAGLIALVAAVSLLGLAFSAIGAGLAAFGIVMAAIITPVGLVIATIGILGLTLYSLKDKIGAFATSANEMFRGWGRGIKFEVDLVGGYLSRNLVKPFNDLLTQIGAFGQSALNFIGQWGQAIRRGFSDAWEGAKKSSIPGLAGLMTGIEDFTKFTIKAFQGMWEYVGGLFQKMGGAIEKLGNDIKGIMGIDTNPIVGGAGGFVSPVAGGRGLNETAKMEVQRYGAGRGYGGKKHFGEDYSGAVGADVRAIAGGTITSAGPGGRWGRNNANVSLGRVSIESLLPDGKRLRTVYYHLGADAGKAFKVGMQVKAGDVIGSIGKDGAVGDNVPHVDVKTDIDGRSTPPMDVWRKYASAAVQGTSMTMSTDLKRVLDLIAKGEVGTTGNEGYYKRQGKGTFSAEEARRGFPTSVPASENIGRYQVNKGDYDEARKRDSRIKDFSPESQDLIAIQRMKNSNGLGSDKGATALRAFIASRTKANAQQLLDDLGAEWESLRDGGTRYKGLDRRKNYRAELVGSDESIYRQLGVGQQSVAQQPAAQKLRYEPGQNPANKQKNSTREQKKEDREKETARNKEERARKKADKEAISDAKGLDKALGQIAGAAFQRQPKPVIAKKPKSISKKAMDGYPDIETLQLGVESANADSQAEISRSQLDVDQGIYGEAEGRKHKAEIESRRSKKLAVYFKQLSGLYKKYKGNDKATNDLRGIETGINTAASGAATAGKESGLDAITNLEKKVKAITDKFTFLKANVDEKRSRGTITEAGAANETSYLNGRLSQSLQQARKDSIALMSSYKDPAALDRLNAITTAIQQQAIETKDAEKARKATALDAGIEAIQKVGRTNATKDFEEQLAAVEALAKAGVSETEIMKMKLQLQRNLSAALQGSIPFVERFMAGYKDPKAQEAGKEILANTRAVRAELIAMEREQAKRIATDVSTRTDKLTARGDRETKDVENDRDLGLITEAKMLEKILAIRIKTNKAIQESVASLEAARDLQTDPAVLETLNEELAKLRQLNIGTKIAEKQYKETNDAASLQGQIVASTKEGLGDLFRSIAKGAGDLGSVLDSILNKIADILINAAIGSFGGSGGGGGGILGALGSILGFKKGGDVPTKGGIQSIAGISRALKKEGSNAILATLTPGERVLNRREAAIHRAMIADGTWKQATKVYGFAKGGDVGNVRTKARTVLGRNESVAARVVVDRINEVNYVSVDQLQAVLEVQLPAAARAGAAMTERNLQSTSWRQSNGIR